MHCHGLVSVSWLSQSVSGGLGGQERLKAFVASYTSEDNSKESFRYLDAFPVFKSITGEAFEKDHWKILFGLLKTPKEVTEENLKVQHAP